MIRDDRKVIAVNDRFHAVKGTVRITDRESGKVAMARTFEVAANATAELGAIAWAGQGVFLIEAEMDGDRLRNYYLYGDPPFDFARFSPLLDEARR